MTNSMLHPTRLRNTTTLKHWKICCALGAAGFVFSAGPVSAQTHSNNLHSLTLAQPPNSQQTNSATPQNPADKLRDGQHDFDFEIGRWNIHLKRLKDRLAGSTTWVEFDGTTVTRKIWDGRGNFEEFETDSAGGHIEGLTLRVYNPQTHQWSIYWANSKDPELGQPMIPMIGEFKNGIGEFYCQDLWKGRSVFVRFIWSNITSKSAHFEQAYSDDGGKTWEVNWITDQTRVKDDSDKSH